MFRPKNQVKTSAIKKRYWYWTYFVHSCNKKKVKTEEKEVFNMYSCLRCVYTGCKAKVDNLCEWSFTSLAQTMPTAHPQFRVSEVTQLLAKFASGWSLLQVVGDIKFWLLCIALHCFTSSVNTPLILTKKHFQHHRISIRHIEQSLLEQVIWRFIWGWTLNTPGIYLIVPVFYNAILSTLMLNKY